MTPFIVMIIGAGILAAVLAYTGNWLALRPWRRSRHEHWTERARLAYPVMKGIRDNLFAIPVSIVLSIQLLWPHSSPLWFFAGSPTSCIVMQSIQGG